MLFVPLSFQPLAGEDLSYAARRDARYGKNDYTVQGIIKEWAVLEWAFLAGESSPAALLALFDVFQGDVEAFLSSEMYRIYRYSPAFKRPDEILELKVMAALIPRLREALAGEDREANPPFGYGHLQYPPPLAG